MFVSEAATALFTQALSMEPARRMQFVTGECGNDGDLLDEVSSLLAAADESVVYFDSMAGRVSLSAMAENDELLHTGKTVGHWRLVRCIGRGGMGSVYLADRADNEFDKQAAVKLLPFGMDDDTAKARLVQERQILARLVHDNIARLLDGGVTDDGVPYFVMDYVQGEPIDLYCERNNLGLHERLRLVLDVADALQYAHRNLVIHRDLKPSNVLVEDDGRVRLLDFGIAKIMEPNADKQAATRFAHRPVTPAYASPEMLSGEQVDVTADVYSLGVLIYALLTRHLPISYEGLSIAQSIDRANTTTPPPPSLLAPRVHPDVDAILMKALSRDPADRYSSIDSLANDIRAYLEGRPVTAKEPTAFYRLARFINRNSIAVAATTVAALSLITLTSVAVSQANEARKQRDAVLLEQQRVHASNEFFGGLIDELDTTPMTSLALLDKATLLLRNQYDNEQSFMAYTLYEIARRYARLNETDKQVALLEQVIALSGSRKDERIQAASLCRLSSAVSPRDAAKAERYFVQGKAAFNALSEPGIDASVDCLRMLASKKQRENDIDGALELLMQAKTITESQEGVSVDIRGPLLDRISYTYYIAGQAPKSLDYLSEALSLLDAAGRGNSLGYLRLASNKASVLNSIGKLPESLAVSEKIVQRIRDTGYAQRGSAGMLHQHGSTLSRVGRNDDAARLYKEARDVAVNHGDLRGVATSDIGMARAALANSNFEQAMIHLDQLRAYAAQDTQADVNLVKGGEVLRVKVFRLSGQLDQALTLVNQLLDEAGYPEVERAPHLISLAIQAAAINQEMGTLDRAETLATDVIRRLSARAIGDPLESVDVGRAYIHRAEIRAALGDNAAAIEDILLGLPVLKEKLDPDHKETLDALALLARIQ